MSSEEKTKNLFLGYHASISGRNKAKNIVKEHESNLGIYEIPINLFQVFLGSPRSLYSPNISLKEQGAFNSCINEFNITIFSHAPYVLNLAKNSQNDADYVAKIYQRALDDLRIVKTMGGVGSVFHVGKYLKLSKEEAINNMYTNIKAILDKISLDTHGVFILETAAGQGTELITTIQEFGAFYHRFSDEDKKKLKVCIDTCHVFAAGHKLTTHEDMKSFIDLVETHINWSNIALIHLNDSKKGCNSCVDRHANICDGFIWKDDNSGLKKLLEFATDKAIPMVLETPLDGRDTEIKNICDMIKK